jgi:hypothetical protein
MTKFSPASLLRKMSTHLVKLPANLPSPDPRIFWKPQLRKKRTKGEETIPKPWGRVSKEAIGA